jgi:teichuronic acid biosynthesis glycosyltransferase TuaG
MPSFNSCKYISEAIESVLMQTVSDFELVIVDGGSTDQTTSIIRQYEVRDKRVRYVVNHDDRGPAHARARGIRASAGKFIAFLDADDVWLPTKLAEQVGFMESRGIDFSYTYYSGMAANGSKVTVPYSAHSSYGYWKLLASRGIGTLTVIIRRELLSDDVLERQKKSGGEELLWWLIILRKGHVAQLYPKDLARYRSTAGSLSTYRWKNQKSVWHTYREELGHNLVLSSMLYQSYIIDVAFRRLRTVILTLFQS